MPAPMIATDFIPFILTISSQFRRLYKGQSRELGRSQESGADALCYQYQHWNEANMLRLTL
jgi:hypothetical protein